MSPNPIVYWELASHDADETVQFLRDVFDWEPEWDQQVGGCTTFPQKRVTAWPAEACSRCARPRCPF